jgi:hypothetical protein
MATFSGANIHFAIDDEGATERTLTGVRTVSFPMGFRTSEIHAVGDSIVKERVNLDDVTFTVEGQYDDTADTGTGDVLPAIWDNSQANPGTNYTFVFGPEGSTTGMPRRTGEAVMTSYEENTELDGLVLFRAKFRANTITIDTF